MSDEEIIGDDLFKDPSGKLPPALCKALIDPFAYALGMRDGLIIRFSEAELASGDAWVHLLGTDEGGICLVRIEQTDRTFPRGIVVRLSDIMWVADAPDGS